VSELYFHHYSFIPLHVSIFYSPLQNGRSAELLASFPGSDMKSAVMRFWLKRRDKLIHPYLLVGYFLLPNPIIMAHVNDNRFKIHQQAVIVLIKRLIFSLFLVGANRTRCLAEAINTFWDEFACFTINFTMFCFSYM
jgi:hypothetical protein